MLWGATLVLLIAVGLILPRLRWWPVGEVSPTATRIGKGEETLERIYHPLLVSQLPEVSVNSMSFEPSEINDLLGVLRWQTDPPSCPSTLGASILGAVDGVVLGEPGVPEVLLPGGDRIWVRDLEVSWWIGPETMRKSTYSLPADPGQPSEVEMVSEVMHNAWPYWRAEIVLHYDEGTSPPMAMGAFHSDLGFPIAEKRVRPDLGEGTASVMLHYINCWHSPAALLVFDVASGLGETLRLSPLAGERGVIPDSEIEVEVLFAAGAQVSTEAGDHEMRFVIGGGGDYASVVLKPDPYVPGERFLVEGFDVAGKLLPRQHANFATCPWTEPVSVIRFACAVEEIHHLEVRLASRVDRVILDLGRIPGPGGDPSDDLLDTRIPYFSIDDTYYLTGIAADGIGYRAGSVWSLNGDYPAYEFGGYDVPLRDVVREFQRVRHVEMIHDEHRFAQDTEWVENRRNLSNRLTEIRNWLPHFLRW